MKLPHIIIRIIILSFSFIALHPCEPPMPATTPPSRWTNIVVNVHPTNYASATTAGSNLGSYAQPPNGIPHVPESPSPVLGAATDALSITGSCIAPALCGIALAYGLIYARIHQLTIQVSKHGAWARWRADIPLPALRELPHPDIADTLRNTINKRYRTVPHASLLHALIEALRDIDQELKDAVELRALYRWIKRLHCSMLFPHPALSDTQIQERNERLLFLKEIISNSIPS